MTATRTITESHIARLKRLSPRGNKRHNHFVRLIAFGDRHYPSNIRALDKIILDVIRDFQPHIIIDGGDPINANQISVFPKTHGELVGLQDELEGDYMWRKAINEVAPNARKILLKDNHVSRRLEKLLCEQYWLDDMSIADQRKLFSLDELGWELLPYWDWKGELLFIHGDRGRGRGGTARLPINSTRTTAKNYGVSVVRFHTHGTGFEIHRRYDNRFLHAIQLGCMQDPGSASYLEHGRLSNWSHSFGVFYLSTTSSHFFFVPCVVIDNMTMFNGKLYKGY